MSDPSPKEKEISRLVDEWWKGLPAWEREVMHQTYGGDRKAAYLATKAFESYMERNAPDAVLCADRS